ncbi:MAG: hypothetical protein ACREQ5_23665 [Candidatus Dormibacteria bacterium]
MDTYAFQAEVTRIRPIGLTAQGLRLNISLTGSVTEGQLAGCTVEVIDYLLIRPDGVAVIDARDTISDGNLVIAAIRAEGYIVPPFPLPELSVLADPNFQWPDVDIPAHGAHFWETSREDLSTAAATVYGFSGSVNIGAGVLKLSARSLAGASQSAGVD